MKAYDLMGEMGEEAWRRGETGAEANLILGARPLGRGAFFALRHGDEKVVWLIPLDADVGPLAELWSAIRPYIVGGKASHEDGSTAVFANVPEGELRELLEKV